MTRAKPAYDKDGSWKYRQFNPTEWAALGERIQSQLKPLYPDKSADEDPTFGHPADEWSIDLLRTAHEAVSTMLWLQRRRTNEELRAERADLLTTLTRVVNSLSTVSHDLDILFGVDADILGTRDKIKVLIPHVEASADKIMKLPRAVNIKDAQSAAALEMAIRCLRILKEHGGTTAATADTYLGYFSDAVRILKIIGDELGLCLDETTWKRVIAKAKEAATDLQELRAPQKRGA